MCTADPGAAKSPIWRQSDHYGGISVADSAFETAMTFAGQVRDIDDVSALRAHFTDAALHLGFEHWAVARFSPPFRPEESDLIIDGFGRDWRSLYVRERHYEVDPIFHAALKHTLPMAWSEFGDARTLTRRQRAMLRDAHRFGLVDGISLPLRFEEMGTVVVSMAAPQHDLDKPVRHAFHLIALHTGEVLRRLLPRQAKQPVGEPSAASPQKSVPADVDARTDAVSLTDREREILNLLSKGDSIEDAAEKLDISKRTVRFHINNVRAKYDVATTMQAVVRALADDQLSVN